jgi:cytochrome bd-type quinol oxidase subunit 2
MSPQSNGPRSRSERRARGAAAVAVVLAVVAGAWLIAWPCSYVGDDGTSTTCSSLIDVNGAWVLALLVVPVAISLLAVLAVAARLRPAAWALAALLLIACGLAVFSIGIFYVPSAVALVVAAACTPRADPRVVPSRPDV